MRPHASGREVSGRAYRSIEHRLPESQQRVVDVLSGATGSMTARQIHDALSEADENVNNSNVRARLNELRAKGEVVVDRLVTDQQTGQSVRAYRLAKTGQRMMLPARVPRRELERQIEALQHRITELERLVERWEAWHEKNCKQNLSGSLQR